MKFDKPAGQNPIDQLKVIGKPTDRIDGRYKTTGRAPYAAGSVTTSCRS
jgi:xanthine dehydrogenase YagR molybdenum-binding subunit